MDIDEKFPENHLSRKDLPNTPFELFDKWFEEFTKIKKNNLHAFTLATASKKGIASCRTMLWKTFTDKGMTFYTHITSRKGQELKESPFACASLYWEALQRQIIIEGHVVPLSREESANYFATRPFLSQVGSLASRQGKSIDSRATFQAALEKIQQEYKDKKINLPDHWGGYILKPLRVEFWQEQPYRLHDRFTYKRSDLNSNKWSLERLFP